MNRRQRSKIVPNIWIIAAKRSDTADNHFALYAIDWRRGARLNWEGWERYEDVLQFHVPIKRKVGLVRRPIKVTKRWIGIIASRTT